MAASAQLIVKILTDASQATKGAEQAASGFGKFQGSMQKLVAPAAAVVAGVTAIGLTTMEAASDVQQAMGAVDSVFGKSAGEIKKWAAGASEAVGLSTAEYGQFAAVIGAQLKNLGVPMQQVAGNTNDLIALGADLAATYGGTTQQAVDALSSALRGEADPAERYGLALNQTRVNAELAAQGLDGLSGEALTAAKAQTIMSLATEQAGGAVGQFGREADTVAGQQARANAAWADASAALGEALLPAATAAAGVMADFGKWVQQNASWITPLVIGIGALAAAVLVINGALIAYNAVQTAMKAATVISTAAQWAFNAAMAANPIGIIILAVTALVAAFIYLWNTNEEFRNFFISLWEGIASFFTGLWNGLMAIVQSVIDGFKSAWNSVAKFFQTVWMTAVALVNVIFQQFKSVFTSIFNAVRNVIQTVTNFFKSVWTSAVNAVKTVINTLKNVFTTVFNAIMRPINAVKNAFDSVVNAIRNVISWLGRIKIPDVFGAIGNLFSAPAPSSAPRMASYATPAVYGYQGAAVPGLLRAGAVSSGGTTININGGLDSADAIARRIQQLLSKRDRRALGVTIHRSIR